ncbi:MAG: methionine--tRNA ligase [Verrucomicrobia bacterium]|nr:MAG: methionine--tRNA ligase [Verrucomicrobiota bacterium]
MAKPFYLTTAIYYVNGEPHLGHAYEMIVADVIARARREHGQKVQQAAVAEGKAPQAYCDELAAIWKAFAQKLELTNDDFVRTTEARHQKVVQTILARLQASGQFYRELYRGFYSTKEETFLTDRDRRPDGTFDPAYGEVIELEEENYYFKLKDHQAWLIEHIEKNPSFVAPESHRNGVLGFLKHNVLEDLCITRPCGRLSWGIPVPFDPGYVTYVWFDALVNYVSIPAAREDPGVLSALGLRPRPSLWPADVHLIGKDILKFHAVFWPIMLKAMGLPLPKQVLVHGFWEKNGQKMSKTTGNVVDPVAVINEWGVDAFRFYVVRELDIGPDGNWTDDGFRARYSAELANGLGNLVNRSLAMLKRYRNGQVPALAKELAPDSEKVIAETRALLEQNQLQGALLAIWSLVARANQYVDHTAPFKLAKDPSKAQRLDEALYNLVEVCRILAVLLWPFLPGTAAKIYAQLGLESAPDKFSAARWGELPPGHAIGTPAPLFPRKDA